MNGIAASLPCALIIAHSYGWPMLSLPSWWRWIPTLIIGFDWICQDQKGLLSYALSDRFMMSLINRVLMVSSFHRPAKFWVICCNSFICMGLNIHPFHAELHDGVASLPGPKWQYLLKAVCDCAKHRRLPCVASPRYRRKQFYLQW